MPTPSSANNLWIPAYAGMTVAVRQPPYHVIPSVAEESKNPEMESRASIRDSSATLGMTSLTPQKNQFPANFPKSIAKPLTAMV